MDWLDHGFNLILIYMIAGFVGTLWETCLYAIKDHRFVMSNGSIATPFNFVYGLGGSVICAALVNIMNYPYLVFIVGAILGGMVEYFVASLEQWICHTKSWDYTGRILSINGKTTVPIMLGWGLLCLFIVYVLYIPFIGYLVQPYILNSASNIHIYHTVMICCLSFIIWDLLWVLVLMIRNQQRAQGHKPLTFIGVIVDKLFPEKYVRKHFPNAQFRPDFVAKVEKEKEAEASISHIPEPKEGK